MLMMFVDGENPVISDCPRDQYKIVGSGEITGSVTWTPPTAKDNSGNQTLTSDFVPGDIFCIGTTRVRYVSRDETGNIVLCTFDVVLSGKTC